mgnify:CR=1 FL=1
MIQIAVLGYGTVGSGVVEVINTNHDSINKRAENEINIKYVLDLRDFPGDPVEKVLVHDYEVIANDPEVDIVVEVMGGVEPAYTFTKRALEAGKSVCTSNKELVARHGTELLAIAKEHGANYLFEASCGGGIPIIRPLKQCLAANEIDEVIGIMNGTTNYILTRMTQSGLSYDEALKEATDLGYAEADPTADVDGLDAGRKIAIMASIAFHSRVTFSDVYIEGIRNITAKDIFYAKEFNSVIKLVGIARKDEDGIEVKVLPILIPQDHPLATVNDSFNAVFVHGTASDDTMYYGRGAGKRPTASAVTGDLCTVARHIVEKHSNLHVCSCYKELPVKNIQDTYSRFFLRLQVADRPGVLANITSVFGTSQVSIAQIIQKSRQNGNAELVIITDEVKELYFTDALNILKRLSIVNSISSLIRVY